MSVLKRASTRQVLAVGFALAAIFPGQEIAFSIQWPFYEALRTTAGIIFAVIGAWITVIYPRGLERVFNRKIDGSAVEVEKVTKLLKPLFYSTIILALVLIIGPLSQIMKQFPFVGTHVHLMRGLSFGVLLYLTFVQMWSLLLTLDPAQIAHEELNEGQYKKDLRSRLQSMGKG